ncbi:MAG: hypothetical protein V8S81_03340 [Oscillospiraceae bacterium]
MLRIRVFRPDDENGTTFWLDAIRVYDPMGKDNATYEQDNEGYPQYIKLHDELVKTGSSIDAKPGTTVFIDGAAKAKMTIKYKNGGPNNEVYLANGQAITFKSRECQYCKHPDRCKGPQWYGEDDCDGNRKRFFCDRDVLQGKCRCDGSG